jgi:hypothetical protein
MSSRNSNQPQNKKQVKKSKISMISSCRIPYGSRTIGRAKTQQAFNYDYIYQNYELDSRADTCCAGSATRVIKYTGQVCNVYPYSPKYKPRTNIPIVKAVTAFDHGSSETFILCLNQALYFGDEMPNSLLNQNQMRYNGVIVNDCPTFLSPNQESSHSLYTPDEDIHLPLSLNGCISYLPTRIPSDHEIQNCTWLTLTSDEVWEPYRDMFHEQEKLAQQRYIRSVRADFLEPYLNLPTQQDNFDRLLGSISSTFLPMNLKQSPIKHCKISSLNNSNQKTKFTHKGLSEKWGISHDTAVQTLKITTQKFIRSAINPIER